MIRAISTFLFGLLVLCVCSAGVQAQFVTRYDYDRPVERVIYAGMQALLTCNGLFVSNRTLDQLYEAELKLDRMPLAPPAQVMVDEKLRAVAVNGSGVVMRAAYRDGLGCIVMGPEQTFEDIERLPSLSMPPSSGDAPNTPWPDGDLVRATPLPDYIDQKALQTASDFAFNREKYGHPSQITLSLLVVHKGEIVLERYAPGVDFTTKTRTWSTAKSIAGTLIGVAVGDGKLALDQPLPFKDWGSGRSPVPDSDPRRKITLRNVLNMSSGLYPIDDVSATGSMLSYFGGASSVRGALDRGLVREPGSTWNYENYDSLVGVYALKTVLSDSRTYLEFPRRALFDRIGMRNTVVGMDRFGDYVLSSQIYTNARDLARFGLLYLNDGMWNGKPIVPDSWIRFARTPTPGAGDQERQYGGQFWLVPDSRTDLPQDAYSTNGSRGQFTIIIPSYDLVIVRRGEDWLSRDGFSNWDLAREVLKAFPDGKGGEKMKDGSSSTDVRQTSSSARP